MTESPFTLPGFLTPEEIRRRIGKAVADDATAFGLQISQNFPDPASRIAAQIGGALGRGIGGAFLASKNPDLQLAKQRQTILSGIDITDKDSVLEAAKKANQVGDTELAFGLLNQAKKIKDLQITPFERSLQENLGKRVAKNLVPTDNLDPKVQDIYNTVDITNPKTFDTAIQKAYKIGDADLASTLRKERDSLFPSTKTNKEGISPSERSLDAAEEALRQGQLYRAHILYAEAKKKAGVNLPEAERNLLFRKQRLFNVAERTLNAQAKLLDQPLTVGTVGKLASLGVGLASQFERVGWTDLAAQTKALTENLTNTRTPEGKINPALASKIAMDLTALSFAKALTDDNRDSFNKRYQTIRNIIGIDKLTGNPEEIRHALKNLKLYAEQQQDDALSRLTIKIPDEMWKNSGYRVIYDSGRRRIFKPIGDGKYREINPPEIK